MIVTILVVGSISAYHLHSATALGETPRLGIVAAPRAYLGDIAEIEGKKYQIRDVHPGGGWDIWMDSTRDCIQFGRRKREVKITCVNPSHHHKRGVISDEDHDGRRRRDIPKIPSTRVVVQRRPREALPASKVSEALPVSILFGAIFGLRRKRRWCSSRLW